MNETITTAQIAAAAPGKINGHCGACDKFTVLHADFLCLDCTDPVAEEYTNHLGHTGTRVTHPANPGLAVLVTEEPRAGYFTAWWSDSLGTIARGTQLKCVAFAKSAARRPRTIR